MVIYVKYILKSKTTWHKDASPESMEKNTKLMPKKNIIINVKSFMNFISFTKVKHKKSHELFLI